MNPSEFFGKLYERLEIGKRTAAKQLTLFVTNHRKYLTVTEYYLGTGLRTLRAYIRKKRGRANRHLPLTPVELRFIRQKIVVYLWHEMTDALSDTKGYGPDIAERDFASAERAQVLFLETFEQLCHEFHLSLDRTKIVDA